VHEDPEKPYTIAQLIYLLLCQDKIRNNLHYKIKLKESENNLTKIVNKEEASDQLLKNYSITK
jgi:hypothetical protein